MSLNVRHEPGKNSEGEEKTAGLCGSIAAPDLGACECPARKALEALIDTAKSYRSDILRQPAQPGDTVGMMFAKYNHAPKRCDRDTVIDEANAALSAPCPCEGLRQYAHMCRDEHEQIGHNDSRSELCPLCRAIDARDRLQSERDQLRAELAEAKRDAARLDWLESHPREVAYGEGYRGSAGGWIYRDRETKAHTDAASLRAAMDAAMRSVPR